MSHILLYRACNVFLKTPCLGYQKIPIRIGIFHACILAGSPEKATKMAEKKQAAQKCYGARGCLLKFRARSGLTEWSVTMHIRQAARAEVVSNSSGKSVAGTYLKIPIRIPIRIGLIQPKH